MGHILVIDDDEAIREMLRRLLERNGYRVTTAEDGREGLLTFQQESFDVVITDVLMPEMDGIEIIMQLLNQDSNVRIIAISGGGRIPSNEYLHLAGELGALRQFVKPVNKDVLLGAVRELCGSSLETTIPGG
ncbi:response regulator [Desulfopila sp. IMCC35008]|uniref:response regulator n=1 Tax=Desulfopila sp. IMCC35008 TaxID=2653858 RepID=UPI0013D3E820|nr:response regulator [Desulfopila sp. IMCC35008]